MDEKARWSLRAWLVCLLGVFFWVALAACSVEPPIEGCDAPMSAPSVPYPEGEGGELARRMFAMACGAGSKSVPDPRNFSAGVEAYASYVGQTTCSPSAKPGVVAFRDMVRATYPCTGDFGIVRACNVGGTSEHKEGRAWDWKLNYPHPAADALLNWLLATDSNGVRHAMARRLGIMYMIWNRKVWRSYRPNDGWVTYTGSNPHTDHVHFSFSWAGANKQTSYWQGTSAPATDPNGCTTTQRDNCSKVGCACVNGQCSGGFCDGTGCTSKQTQDCGAFGCGCVDGQCAGGACAGSGCTAKQNQDCGKFGCGCADGKCSGGACAGSGCTYKQTHDCGAYGCNCADGGCSGGFCPNGTGCTFKETQDCAAKGCGCVDHVCAGGSCAGTGCTAGKTQECQKQSCGCAMMECRGGSCCDGKPETCDGKDNDCDGKIDEGAPGGGQPCQDDATGRSGKTRCQGGKLVCVPDPLQEPPPTEVVEEAASEPNASEPPAEPNASESSPDASPDAVAPEDIDTENPPETIYPEWPSYCQAFPEACKEGVLNLRTLEVGEVGCEEMSDCRTQLCVKREGVGRCALACRDQSDCPARFECIEGSICWPKPGASSADIQPCREPRDCQSDERCVSGVCVGGKDRCVGGYCPGGSGASCACSASANDPFSPLLWLGLLLLLPLWRRRIARL